MCWVIECVKRVESNGPICLTVLKWIWTFWNTIFWRHEYIGRRLSCLSLFITALRPDRVKSFFCYLDSTSMYACIHVFSWCCSSCDLYMTRIWCVISLVAQVQIIEIGILYSRKMNHFNLYCLSYSWLLHVTHALNIFLFTFGIGKNSWAGQKTGWVEINTDLRRRVQNETA